VRQIAAFTIAPPGKPCHCGAMASQTSPQRIVTVFGIFSYFSKKKLHFKKSIFI